MKAINQTLFAVSLSLLINPSTSRQREKSTLLPSSEAKDVTTQCSRPAPSKFSETWMPTEAEVKEMESRLSEIKKLRVEKCCIVDQRIEDPNEYYMQYVGIVVDGKKLIYINAFADSKPPENWKEKARIICDGGSSYWGVLYDSKTKRFYDLATNGIG